MNKDYTKIGVRIPLEIRTNKTKARTYLQHLIDEKIKIENPDIYALSSWCGFDIDKYKHTETHSEIDIIEYVGKQQTSDLSVDDGHSFVSNGIICHNTVNLPEDATEELVSKVYTEAWKSGCKGVTVYRDGCRSGVLVSNEKKDAGKTIEDIIKESHAPKRSKIIKCDILRFNNNKEKWIGFVGTLEDKPYEIFTGLLDAFQVPTFVDDGWIRKVKEIKKDDDGNDVKASRYDFLYIDKDGYEQEMRGLSRAFNREYWNYGKLTSAILRHGMPIQIAINLIDSLNFVDDSIVSWKNGVKRMLKKYISDDTKIENNCPECDTASLKYESGCVSCTNCGYSKCS